MTSRHGTTLKGKNCFRARHKQVLANCLAMQRPCTYCDGDWPLKLKNEKRGKGKGRERERERKEKYRKIEGKEEEEEEKKKQSNSGAVWRVRGIC